MLRVDGGMAVNDWLLQFLADILDVAVERPAVTETTALGVAYLAGLQIGLLCSSANIEACWTRERRFEPAMTPARRDTMISGWHKAVARVRHEAVYPAG